jgi:hypothetical protein
MMIEEEWCLYFTREYYHQGGNTLSYEWYPELKIVNIEKITTI